MLKRCLTLVGLVYMLSLFNISDAAAKICFLPDGSCGTGKITKFDSKSKSGCMYKTEAEARNGLGECETVYPKEPCYYRKCASNGSTIFDDLASCKKKLGDNQECTSCGSCYKIVEKSGTSPDNTKCTIASDCISGLQVFEENGTTDSNNNPCGTCKPVESCPEGYSTIYQSQSDCLTGESFSSSGTANGKVCGKCTYQCSDYTLTSKKDEHCYYCTPCPYDPSKFSCKESVSSNYQLVNGVCSQKTTTESCESKGKHTSVGSWSSECAKNGGTPGPDTDGCFICKQGCAQKYTDSNGYKIIDSSGTCDTGYVKYYMGVRDDSNNSCYVCRPELCSDHNVTNGIQYAGKDETCSDGRQKLTFTSITSWDVANGPCYPCVRPCSYYGYTSVKPDCSNAKYVSTPEGLGCWTCSGSSGSSDTCVTTATTGSVTNGSKVYFYGSSEEYNASKNGTCIGSMTITAECKVYHKSGSYTETKTALFINGTRAACKTGGTTSCSYTDYSFTNDVVVCSGCSPTVYCTHKWGGGSFTLTGVPLDSNAGTYSGTNL